MRVRVRARVSACARAHVRVCPRVNTSAVRVRVGSFVHVRASDMFTCIADRVCGPIIIGND